MKYKLAGDYKLPHFAFIEIVESNGIKTVILCCDVFVNKRINLPVQFKPEFSDNEVLNDGHTVQFIKQIFSYLDKV